MKKNVILTLVVRHPDTDKFNEIVTWLNTTKLKYTWEKIISYWIEVEESDTPELTLLKLKYYDYLSTEPDLD
jgi:hypothetical protein